MSGQNDIRTPYSDEMESFKAYEVARSLDDLTLLPQLKSYVDQNQDAATLKYAFDLIGFVGKNTKSKRVIDILVSYLKSMEDDEDSLYSILSSIGDINVKLAKDEGLEAIAYYAFDDRGLIRTAALRTLPLYEDCKDFIVGILEEIIRYHYDQVDLKYAILGLIKLFPAQWNEIIEKNLLLAPDSAAKQRIEEVLTSFK
jgi:hypothetical protein